MILRVLASSFILFLFKTFLIFDVGLFLFSNHVCIFSFFSLCAQEFFLVMSFFYNFFIGCFENYKFIFTSSKFKDI